jgi:enoyl-CoA hydratase
MDEFSLSAPVSGVAVLSFSRPEVLNCLSDAGVAAVAQCLEAIAADANIRVLILTGAGRAFCSGFDLRLAHTAPRQDELGEAFAWTRRQEAFAALVLKLRALPQPVIAAVNGPAHGAGLGLALAAEIRIASPQAEFCAAFVKVGMSGCDVGVSWLLPRLIGMSRAFEMMLTGRTMPCSQALECGLISSVHAREALLPAAIALAQQMMQHNAVALWFTKRGAWANAETGSLQAALELENRSQILARTTGDLARAARKRGS